MERDRREREGLREKMLERERKSRVPDVPLINFDLTNI